MLRCANPLLLWLIDMGRRARLEPWVAVFAGLFGVRSGRGRLEFAAFYTLQDGLA